MREGDGFASVLAAHKVIHHSGTERSRTVECED
jgi:hypothetical protein